MQIEHARLCATQLEEVVDEACEAVGFFAERAVIARNRRRIADDSVFERFDHGTDAGKRRPQIVRNPGDELTP